MADANIIVRRPTPVPVDESGSRLYRVWWDRGDGKRDSKVVPEHEAAQYAESAPVSKGQGSTTAVSARTGWEYEHDETDAQINAIEDLILDVREQEGVGLGASPADRGAVFTWSSSTNDGEGVISIATTYAVPGDGSVSLGGRGVLEGHVWATEAWEIDPDGTVRELGVR